MPNHLKEISNHDFPGIIPAPDWRDVGEREHFVQFYEHDEYLIRSVTGFVAAGLRSGESAIVIATETHGNAIDQHLRDEGIDVDAAREDGTYITLDASEVLSKFMVNGAPDETLFREFIGELVRRAGQNSKGVRAFGEMVAVLWADGNTDGAIQLEQLWNLLGKEQTFSLFCAYPMSGFSNAANGQPLVHICKEHSRVIPGESYPSRASADEQRRQIAFLQQQANSLRAEIAERERVEKELRRSKAELSAFVENASLGLHWTGPDGVILWANRAELELYGYSSDEYIGHHVSEFLVDREHCDDILARLDRGERIRNYETRIRCKDGSIKTVLFDSSIFREDGRFVHTQCFTRDISERKVAEEAAQRLAAIVEFSDDAIVSKDLNGIIMSWNPGAQRLFGYTAEEAIGKSVTILIPENAHDEEPLILDRIRRGERIDHYETTRRRKDGSMVEISLSVSPIKNRAGKIIGASKIARDISERKRNEEATRQAKEDLARANEDLERRVAERTASLQEAVQQMEEFSYSLSHDLRGPLRAMQGYCHILLEDAASDLEPEQFSYLKRIGDSAERLDRLVQDVLAYSRVNWMEMEFKPVETEKVLLDVLRNYTGEHRPIPEIVIDRPLLNVIAHEASLCQCLSNLVGNALKFVKRGTVPRIHIWTRRVDEDVRIWVEDNGVGIGKDQQEKIFNMFERLPEARDYPGTGVGLAIVKKAVSRMRGAVGVESSPGLGSRFWIQLPAANS